MMKIAEYLAPNERLTPSNEGFAAFETAGRRIGPLYNQAAHDIMEQGKLKAQEIEDLARWPFDILNLRSEVAKEQAAKAAKEGFRIGSVTEGYNATSGNAGRAAADSIAPFQQVSQGGPVIAATARRLIAPQSLGQPTSTTFDPNAVSTGPAYALQNGQFVKVNSQDPNAGYAQQNNQLADQANAAAANEWYNSNGTGSMQPGYSGGGGSYGPGSGDVQPGFGNYSGGAGTDAQNNPLPTTVDPAYMSGYQQATQNNDTGPPSNFGASAVTDAEMKGE